MATGLLTHKLQGASVVVLRRDSVLMVERNRAPSKGLWSFPAGRREPGEDAETNARRELHEETGLTAGPLVLLGTFTPPGAAIELSVFAGRTGEIEPRAGDDAAKAEFVPFERILSRPLTAGAAGWVAEALLALLDPPPLR